MKNYPKFRKPMAPEMRIMKVRRRQLIDKALREADKTDIHIGLSEAFPEEFSDYNEDYDNELDDLNFKFLFEAEQREADKEALDYMDEDLDWWYASALAPTEFPCTNSYCPYDLPAADQERCRWLLGDPADCGLCLNCIDDRNKDEAEIF